MNNQTPLSIITVCKNTAEKISKTLDSVGKQNWQDFEHLIIDGASQDNTAEVIEQKLYPQLRLYSQVDNGIYDAMNKGAALARGDYLLFLNAGDHLSNKNVLQKIFEIPRNSDLLLCNIETVEDKKKKIWQPTQLMKHYHTFQILPHCGVFIKRAFFERSGAYDITYQIAADIEFFNRALREYEASFEYIDIILSVFYRDGLSSTKKGRSIAKKEELRIHWKYYGVLNTLRRLLPLPYTGIISMARRKLGLEPISRPTYGKPKP